MSEISGLPFDTAPDEHEPQDAAPDRRKLLLFIAAGAVVAALIGYFVALPLLSGAKPVTSTVVVTKPPSGGGSGLPSVAPVKPPTRVKTFANVIGRDPFDPLVTAAVAPAPANPPAPSGAPTQPTTTPTTTPTSPTTPAGKTAFTVLNVTGAKATVTVNTKKYTMSTGQVFATHYRLLRITSGSCASFSRGEMRFSLCEGQTFIF